MAKSSIRSTVEGALFSALTVIIAVLSFSMPLMLIISGMLIPLPLTLMVYRHGLKKGFLTFIASYILLLILFPEPLSVSAIMIQFAPLGLLLGLLYKNSVSAGKSIIACTAVSTLLTFTVMISVVSLTGISLSYLEKEMQTAMNESINFYHNTGLMENVDVEDLKQSTEQTMQSLIMLLPGILIIGAMLSSIITYLLSRAVFKRMNYKLVPLPTFSRWTFPWYSLWVVVIGLALTIIGDRYNLSTTAVVGKNIIYVASMIFVLLGVSIATYYYKRIPFHPLIKVAILFLVIIWPFTPFMLLGIGIIDPILDIRKINKEKEA
ncbi:MAG: DUF2232 domain-containing protein [Firmicutes bacterium]|nr:DUF2232 domain-containing protein [Bacillota bacterium]